MTSYLLSFFPPLLKVLEYNDDIEDDYDAGGFGRDTFAPIQPKPKDDDDDELIFNEPEPPPVYEPCDKVTTLYNLQPNAVEGITDAIRMPNVRPFYIKKIPRTNLLLVVINVLMPSKGTKKTTEPQRIIYPTDFPCYKLNMSFYERRRIEECFTEHPEVSENLEISSSES